MYRNKFKTVRIKAERNYYAAEFSKCNSDLRQTWRLIKSIVKLGNLESSIDGLVIDGTKTDNADRMANKFNDYFANIAKSLADEIPNSSTSFTTFRKTPLSNSFGLLPTTPEEIMNLSHSIRLTHSKGIDDIDPCIANKHLASVAQPLADIINCSFTYGIFPQALKTAKIVPIFKRDARDNFTNYRPISLLRYFSKFFEKIMYERIIGFLIKNNVIFPSQHGFQAGHSPSMSLLSMQDRISNAIDRNEYSLGIFFDLAKAFDTVDHGILLSKLERYGIRGNQLQWFKSYLENRSQCVYCNGSLSDLKTIKFGVPQGSNLGPLLFLIYINDLPNVSSKLYFILFADDTNVFYSHSSLETLFQIVNEELTLAANWFCANKLTLNLDKTNYILFKSHRKPCPSQYPILSINGTPLSRVESTKFLGVYVDQHLTWKDHIKCISSKIAKNTGIIARTAYLLPPSVRIKLYYTLVYPYLAYCNLIWASTYTTRLHRLIILQKRVIRIVAGAAYGSHTAPLFYKLNILKFEQIKLYQTGEFMYRYDHGLLPAVYKGFFSLASEIHAHSTRNSSNYRYIFARTNSRLFSVRATGPSIWNNIPQGIRQSPSLVLFKKSYERI